MNEAEYNLMKSYGDRGGCYPWRLQAEADNTLRDLHNSSYDTNLQPNSIIVLLKYKHKGLQRAANECAKERRIYKDLISKNNNVDILNSASRILQF